MRRLSRLITILLILTGLGLGESPSLKGVSKIKVWADLVDRGGTGSCADTSLARDFSLTEYDVRTDTELQLRKYGISIASSSENSPAILHIIISGCSPQSTYVRANLLTITVNLEEWATTDRNTRGVVQTWNQSGMAVSPHDSRSSIQEFVSKFINQWLADNPATPKSFVPDSPKKN